MSFNIRIPFVIASHVRRLASNPSASSRNKSKAGGVWQMATTGLLRWDEAGTVREGAYSGQSSLPLTSPVLTSPLGVVTALEAAFVQVAGNRTHTATFVIPAGGTILDVFVTNTAVWDSDTTATMKVGIAGGDDDCFFIGLDLKTIPAAGKSINFAWPGNASGASVPEIDGGAGAQELGATGGFLYKVTTQSVAAVVTDVNVAGVAGRTRVTVLYSVPSTVIAPVVV